MPREFFVLDGTGHVSYSARSEEPESFPTIKAATRRARVLAKSEPGETVVITTPVAYVTCEVSAPKVKMSVRKLRA